MANVFGRALARAVPQIVTMQGQVAELQERAKRLRMEEEMQPYRVEGARLTVQQAKNQHKLFEQEQSRRGGAVNINTDSLFMAFSPENQKQIKDDLFAQGIINDQGIGTRGDLEDFVKSVESQSVLFKKYLEPEILNAERQVTDIYNKLQEEMAKDSPNEKKVSDLTQRYKMSIVNVQTKRGNYEGLLKALEDREEKPTADTSLAQERLILSWHNQAKSEALRKTMANKPSLLASFGTFLKETPDNPEIAFSKVETMMTPEQLSAYEKFYQESFRKIAPDWAVTVAEERWKRGEPPPKREPESNAGLGRAAPSPDRILGEQPAPKPQIGPAPTKLEQMKSGAREKFATDPQMKGNKLGKWTQYKTPEGATHWGWEVLDKKGKIIGHYEDW